MKPQAELIKNHAIARLDGEAIVHRSNHQNVHARRYVIPNPAFGGIEVVLIVKGNSMQLWCEARAIDGLEARALGGKGRPGGETYGEPGKYGRHSALRTMDRLHRGDAWRFVPKTIGDLDTILDAVKGAK